jgi:hypothetical protein
MGKPIEARFRHALAHGFDPVATLIMVDIVGFPVRQQNKQAMLRRMDRAHGAGVAYRCAGTGIVLQGTR